MAVRTFAEAARDALAGEMRRDPMVWALGEDLEMGGIFGQYRGLSDEFGRDRIVSTPIAEATIMGAGLGAALVGTRPVIEMRIADFALCAFDELVNQIAKARYMFGGQARVPVVVRMPQGLTRHSAAQHSQSLEAFYVHVPGLVVVAPATPADAAGLLRSAIRCDDPVVFLEPRAQFGEKGEVPEGEHLVPIGAARIARVGTDVTLVTWSTVLAPALEAAEAAAARGISVEVIDLRSLWPWDTECVLRSAERSRRVVVAHEAVAVGGFGAEVAATVAESLAGRLLGPVRRVGAPRTPVPFSPGLEAAYRVGPQRILAAVEAAAARDAAPAMRRPYPPRRG